MLLLRPITKYNTSFNNYEKDLISKNNCILVYTKIDTIDQSLLPNFKENEVGISSVNNDIDALINLIKNHNEKNDMFFITMRTTTHSFKVSFRNFHFLRLERTEPNESFRSRSF